MTTIKARLQLKTGEHKEFTYDCSNSDGNLSLNELHASSLKLQTELNTVLTDLVEEEKSKVSENKDKNSVSNDEDIDDEEEEEEDEITPPDEKRQKT